MSNNLRADAIKRHLKENSAQFWLHFVLIVGLFLALYPLMLTLIDSVKSLRDYQFNMWWPSLPIRFYNFGQSFEKLKTYFLNTLLVAAAGISGMLVISSLAAYAIGKIRFPGHNFCLWCVLALMMLPGVMTLVPSSLIYRTLHLNDTYWALIIPIWTNGCLQATFLLTTTYKAMPREIFEAAEVDGAGEIRQFLTIGLPLSAPMMGTCAIMQLISIWNDYLWPMTIQSDTSLYTLPAGILFTYSNYQNVPEQYSAYIFSSLPLLFIFIFLNKYYIKGLMDSAIKM